LCYFSPVIDLGADAADDGEDRLRVKHDPGHVRRETKFEHGAREDHIGARCRASDSPQASAAARLSLLTLSHGGAVRIPSSICFIPACHPAISGGGRSFMSQAYIIEVRSRSAGVVVRQGNAFCFHAATDQFNALHGKTFKSPQRAHQAALAHASAKPILQETDRGT
jgi:hypothetical protein